MIEENRPTKRYGKTVAVDQPVPLAQRPRIFTWARIAALTDDHRPIDGTHLPASLV